MKKTLAPLIKVVDKKLNQPDKQRIIILAGLLTLKDLKKKMLKREDVQELKRSEVLNWDTLRQAFHAVPKFMPLARAHAKVLRTMTSQDIAKKWPWLNALESTIPPHANWSGKLLPKGKPAPDVKIDAKALFAEYCVLTKRRGMKPPKRWSGSVSALAERVAKVKQVIEQETPVKKLPTVVAEGAYNTDRLAKRSLPSKKRKTSRLHNTKAPTTRKVEDGEITLAEIARELDIEPKHARAKARRNPQAYAEHEVEGKHYVFASTSKAAIVKLLKEDRR